jgi:hypothetical protein
MIFALDFFWVDDDASRQEVARDMQHAPSLAIIESRVRATLRNVRLRDRRVNLCIIRDPRGRMLSEIDVAADLRCSDQAVKVDLSV